MLACQFTARDADSLVYFDLCLHRVKGGVLKVNACPLV